MNQRSEFSFHILYAFFSAFLSVSVHATEIGESSKLGERLFQETRFAEFFARHSIDVNEPLSSGDPTLDSLETLNGKRDHPLRGKSVSCAACHLTNETLSTGARLFTDFARRSPVPLRDDGQTHTLRNSPTVTGTALKRLDAFLHFDGEFANAKDLSIGGLTGRNFGWLAQEREKAIAHIAKVIRADLAPKWAAPKGGRPYREEFSKLGLNLNQASDVEIVQFAAVQMAAYMSSLDFSRDEKGLYNGSAYDAFLKKNHLPREPNQGEPPIAYMQRLARLALQLDQPKWVNSTDRVLQDHSHEFRFGPQELRGLVAFTSTGQCVQCHAAPDFTDHLFHNIGVSQEDYEASNGLERFIDLDIPNLNERKEEDFSRFSKSPVANTPNQADLGLWNVLFNPKFNSIESKLLGTLAQSFNVAPDYYTREKWLELSIGSFKTPTLRNLGLSAPYMHSGQVDTIEHAVMFYVRAATFARRGSMRNPDPKLEHVQIRSADDIRSLSAFLRSLDEDLPR